MSLRCNLILFTVLSTVAAAAWPADTTRPGPINRLTVQQTIRALTLRFTATGDDGTAGTAAGYDVRVALPADTANCSSDPAAWPVAPNGAAPRNHGLMAASGTTDFQNVRPLEPDTTYCVAIRARDEVPNYSATWAVASQTTLAGDWPIANIAAPTGGSLPSAGPTSVVLDEVTDAQEPALLTSWMIRYLNTSVTPNKWVTSGIGFARVAAPSPLSADSAVPTCPAGSADCYEQIMLTDPLLSAYIDTLSVGGTAIAAIPGPTGVAALLVRGTKLVGATAQSRTVLLERDVAGSWSSQLVPNVAILLSSGAPVPTSLVYRPDAQLNPTADVNGVWNPVFTWERVDTSTSKKYQATLMLAERVGGVWTNAPLFARQFTNALQPLFPERRLFVQTDGTLALYATPFGTSYNGIYATRPVNGNWSYYDAGPYSALTSGVAPSLAVGLDENGKLLLASSPYMSTNIALIKQSAFAGPFSGLPAINVARIVPTSAWTTVYSQPIPDFGSSSPMGVSGDACDGTVHIATSINQPNGWTYEERVVSVHTGATTDVIRGDRVDASGSNRSAVSMPNGDAVVVYNWGRAPDFTLVARAANGACP